jgi:beta-lactamase class A
MYDIYTKQSISPLASTKMAYLLTRDLNPKAWRNIDANPIEGFLGESLPLDIYYGSKVGYTSRSRQEVAFVRTLNDKAIYILAVFGDDPAYAKNEEVFPKMSRYIFDGLNQTPLKSSPEKVTQLDSLPTVGIEH